MITERISRFIADLDVELKNQTYAAKVIAEKIKLLKQDQQALIGIFEQEGDNLYGKNFYGIYRDGTRIYDFKSNNQSFGEDLFGTKRMADVYERDLVSNANIKGMLRRDAEEDRRSTEKYNKERWEEVSEENQENWEKELLKREGEHEERLKEYAKDLESFNELGINELGITVKEELVKDKILVSDLDDLIEKINSEYAKEFPNDLVEVHKS